MKPETRKIKERHALEQCAQTDSWLPPHGFYCIAIDLTRRGLLRSVGIAAMSPNVLYGITDKGRAALDMK